MERIKCLNVNCRITAAQDKYPGSSNIICQKCWKAMPDRFRREWKRLKAHDRKLQKICKKEKYSHGSRRRNWISIDQIFTRRWDKLNSDIINYFAAGEKPPGIETFLKEIGLD